MSNIKDVDSEKWNYITCYWTVGAFLTWKIVDFTILVEFTKAQLETFSL